MEYLKQGDLIMVNFNPAMGHEQAGYRPALVVSNNDFNELCNGIYKIVPITSKIKEFPLNMELPNNLEVHGQVLLSQERTIDLKFRPYKKVGKVPSNFIKEVVERIIFTY